MGWHFEDNPAARHESVCGVPTPQARWNRGRHDAVHELRRVPRAAHLVSEQAKVADPARNDWTYAHAVSYFETAPIEGLGAHVRDQSRDLVAKDPRMPVLIPVQGVVGVNVGAAKAVRLDFSKELALCERRQVKLFKSKLCGSVLDQCSRLCHRPRLVAVDSCAFNSVTNLAMWGASSSA